MLFIKGFVVESSALQGLLNHKYTGVFMVECRRMKVQCVKAVASICIFSVVVVMIVTVLNCAPVSKPSGPESLEWRLYGNNVLRNVPVKISNHTRNVGHQHLLNSVPLAFQEKLLHALPLDCHPGPQGVFRDIHSKFLNTLMEYAENYSQIGSRTLIWHPKGNNGLGDKIRGITYSLLLAIFSHRRLVLFLDGMPEGKYLLPNMIDWRDEATYQYLTSLTFAFSSFAKPYRLSLMLLNVQGSDIVHSWNSMAEHFEVIRGKRTNVVIHTNYMPSNFNSPRLFIEHNWIVSAMERSGLSHLSDEDIDAVMGITFRYLFKFDRKVFSQLQSAKRALNLTIPYTALHVRTGFVGMVGKEELPLWSKLNHFPSQWQQSYNCAVATADNSLGPDSLIYLATDSDRVKDMALAKYPHRFRSLNIVPLHVGQRWSGIRLTQREEEGILVTWIEMLLLAEANILVKGGSGYAWIAGLLCGLHGNRTVSTARCT